MLDSVLRAVGAYRVYERRLKAQIQSLPVPSHIGIVMDGNRRWAASQGLANGLGHNEGANRAEEILDWCHELGIRTVTLYVLSTENLERNLEEVQGLFVLIESRLRTLLTDDRIMRYKVKVRAIGQTGLLPQPIRDLLAAIETKTSSFEDHYLNIAIAYGGRAEITDMVKAVAQEVKEGRLSPEEITEDTVEKRLYTSFLPNQEPELIVRTSGEERMSGFLLWQAAYSELVFMDVFWPAFRKIDLMRAIRTYQRRTRRHGK
jgi:tritrans,polycis-undecaprenyl-diphosphate synthase [geranylgeranyl-diphosphate specific]